MSTITRRDFLASSAATAALATASGVRAVEPPLLRVGLIGCGGRGTGATAQALRADPNVKLVSMADAFEDRLLTSLATLQKDNAIATKIDVPADRRHVGF